MVKKRIHKDVVIIGAGMAGLTAALYAGRMNLSVLVLENAIVGGQISNATGIENYPGFMKVTGRDLIETVQAQAEHAGAVIDEFDIVEKVSLKATPKIVETAKYIYETDAVIIASGMNRRKLPLPEEMIYANKGVHYCELCDGHLYQDKVIAVMGGGNAAIDAANFLTKYAKKLYVIHRSRLRADEVSIQRLQKIRRLKSDWKQKSRRFTAKGNLRRLSSWIKLRVSRKNFLSMACSSISVSYRIPNYLLKTYP